MQNILFLIVGVAIGFFIKGRTTKTLIQKSPAELDDMRLEAKEAVKERTDERKKKILDFMADDAQHEKDLGACSVVDIKEGVTCADIEKLLDVKGNTARRYLDGLEEEGLIEQIGSTGQGVHYVLK